ncbi:hypothetical protein ABZ446_26355 [Streptomyces sp. NPDC005813]|uniref:DUF6924 domain-containing protein n=1 Tax=Streptomyces sp. NPDC005813 TaxID=3155592 RepID=UPI0033CD6E91
MRELMRPWGERGEFQAQVHLVDDPVWAGAASDEVTVPGAVHDVHANLSIANMGFEEFAEVASTDLDGVLRPL